jgi:predicted phosphodiesterase
MTDHFTADLVLFGHTGQWKQVRLGNVDFLNVGALVQGEQYEYALLEWQNSDLAVQRRTIPPGNNPEELRREKGNG